MYVQILSRCLFVRVVRRTQVKSKIELPTNESQVQNRYKRLSEIIKFVIKSSTLIRIFQHIENPVKEKGNFMFLV